MKRNKENEPTIGSRYNLEFRRLSMKSGATGGTLAEMIKKAIDDGKLTNSEYEKILAVAQADQVVDSQEKKLLSQLQEMLSNKTVIRVPD
jgi:hypothetical protein